MCDKFQYRIRGLAEPLKEVSKAETKSSQDSPATTAFSRATMKILLRALGRPKITDEIYDAPRQLLHDLWPTFDLFTRQWPCKPIKSNPIALGPFIPDSNLLASDPALMTLEGFYKLQTEERKNIESGLSTANDPTFDLSHALQIKTPIAAALICVLFRGSTWVKRQENQLLDTIIKSPLACYILLHLGARPDQRQNLLKQTLLDPWLALALCTEEAFCHSMPVNLVHAAFEKTPHLLPVARFARHEITDQEAWDSLADTASIHPLCAAFALGLDPTDTRAKKWQDVALRSPEGIYWALRVWLNHQRVPSEFPGWPAFQAAIKMDVRWLFHWIRDIDRSEVTQLVEWHWPNPWAVELINDLDLDSELVRELFHKTFHNADEEDPFVSTMALWALKYAEPMEAN
jgi:hypothetical protein